MARKLVLLALGSVGFWLLAAGCTTSSSSTPTSDPRNVELVSPTAPVIPTTITQPSPTVALPSPAPPTQVEPEFSDEELLRAAYEGPKAPENAYQETLQNEGLYYVNTISVIPVSERGDSWIELCSDDDAQAREWALLTDAYSSVHRTFKAERETDKFFEVRYENAPTEPPGYGLARVHKCSYFEPTLDLLSPEYDFGGFSEAALGIFHGPTRLEDIKEFAEYTWFIGNYNLLGHSLVASLATETPDSVTVDLYTTALANMTALAGSDGGSCDSVTLRKLTYRVERASGEVRVYQENIRTFQGECYPYPFIEP